MTGARAGEVASARGRRTGSALWCKPRNGVGEVARVRVRGEAQEAGEVASARGRGGNALWRNGVGEVTRVGARGEAQDGCLGAHVRNRREAWGPGGRGRKRRKTGGAFRSGGQNHGEADSRER